MIAYWWWIIGAGAVVLVAEAVWWLWWRLPKRQMRSITLGDPKARADIEDNFRKTIGQALGGVAVLIGAAAAYYGTQQTLRVSEEQSRLSQQASHDLLISQQVAKGFEQLGSDKIVMRLGGIYALEGVMNDSNQYNQPVLESLCAFVRDGTKEKATDDSGPTTDIQAAVTVIGRRKGAPGRPDLSRSQFPKANLTHADLRLANLSGANLRGADLRGAVLYNADLSYADLSYANLDGADLNVTDLEGANLSGVKNLTQEQLNLAGGKPAQLLEGLKLDAPRPPADGAP